MNLVIPKPIRQSKETVTLSRSDWELLIEGLEDVEDLAAVAERREREAIEGKDTARRNYLTGDELRRLLDWESPVKVWREKRGLSQRALASNAGVSPSYLAEIETGRKPGSANALLNLARSLDVPMEYLISANPVQVTLGQLKQQVELDLPEAETIAAGHGVIATLTAHGVTEADLAELKDHARTLAASLGQDGLHARQRLLQAIIRNCLTGPS